MLSPRKSAVFIPMLINDEESDLRLPIGNREKCENSERDVAHRFSLITHGQLSVSGSSVYSLIHATHQKNYITCGRIQSGKEDFTCTAHPPPVSQVMRWMSRVESANQI